MHKSQVIGLLMVLFGLVILVVLAGFIYSVLVFLLKFVAVAIGVILVLGGIALMLSRRWMKRGPWGWGSAPATT